MVVSIGPYRSPSSAMCVDEPTRSANSSVSWPVGNRGRSWASMNPTGTMPWRFAARSSFVRARSRAASSSNRTRLKRASALRTWASSLIGRRRLPCEST